MVLLDVDAFNDINRRFGHNEGDRFLQALVELVLLNLRNEDLLCRYAGDRFLILLSDTGEELATDKARQLQNGIAWFCFYTHVSEKISATVSTGVATCRDGNIEALMERAKIELLCNKEQNDKSRLVA